MVRYCTDCRNKVGFFSYKIIDDKIYCRNCFQRRKVARSNVVRLSRIIPLESPVKVVQCKGYCLRCKINYTVSTPETKSIEITAPGNRMVLDGVSGIVLVPDEPLKCPKCSRVGQIAERTDKRFVSLHQMKKDLNL